MSLQQRVQALEQRQPAESDAVRFVRFVSASGEPSEPRAFTDHVGWRCVRELGESAEDHRARAASEAREKCVAAAVLFECLLD
jgi:hypothetical protein